MPRRHPTHVKETIACRRFEAALTPEMVTQPVHQGADYGTDYFVSVFDAKGELEGRFGTQVKYIPKTYSNEDHDVAVTKRLWTALDGYSFIDNGPRVFIARHQLSLTHLAA